MIEGVYYVFDQEGEFQNSYTNRAEAEEYASSMAQDTGYRHAVMLKVPVADFPEYRAVKIYEADGRVVYENDAYDPEVVPV